jgi:small subunit ribosomal protein S2
VKSKKEQSRLEKRYKKLYKNLWGVRNVKELPGVLIVIDSNFETIAVEEAKKLGIPIVGIVDTNADPEGISFPVPGNDDAIRSIKLFTSKFGEAVKIGLEKRLSDSLNQEQQVEAESKTENETETAPAAEIGQTPGATKAQRQQPEKAKEKGSGSKTAQKTN